MKLKSRTLEELNKLILGETSFSNYKSKNQLDEFYKQFGSFDDINNTFILPDRNTYSNKILNSLNENNEIEKVIIKFFDPINFVGKEEDFKNAIDLINEYLAYDNLKLERAGKTVTLIGVNEKIEVQSTDRDITRIWGDKDSFRVFLSHKSEFKVEAAILKENLEVYGISCFVAHEDIEPTLEWQNEIEKALFSADTLVALLTSDFHKSNWTDQEIGIAIGRGIPIISLRLGIEPYGFIGKFQGLKIDLEKDHIEIVKLLLKNPKMVDVYIAKVENSQSFIESNNLSELLTFIDTLNDFQVKKLTDIYENNIEVNGSFGFNGCKPMSYGKGLAKELSRIIGKEVNLGKT